MHGATLRLECGDAATARAVRDALAVELEDGPAGTHTSVIADGSALSVAVEAVDLAGLRATLNGVVRLADAAAGTLAPDGNG